MKVIGAIVVILFEAINLIRFGKQTRGFKRLPKFQKQKFLNKFLFSNSWQG